MFAALIAAMFFSGNAYAASASSDSIPDNDVDVSDDGATIISPDDFEDKDYTIIEGGVYKLGDNIEDGHIKVSGNSDGDKITLDLNGHTLTNKVADKSALYVYSAGYNKICLEVTDSEGEGAIVQDEAAKTTTVRIDSNLYTPDVTFNKVKIISSAAQCFACLDGNLVINGATLQTEKGPDDAELIYAKKTSSTASISLNSGTFLVASDASGLFKMEESAKYGYPSLTLNGGTYNRVPVSADLGSGKIIWKTGESFAIGDAVDKPVECKYLVVLSETKELWFTSEDEAESFTKSSEAGGVSFHKVSFAADSGEPSVDVPVQYIADGLYAIEPDDPSPDDYKFNYWKNGESKYDFDNTEVTSDLTLTADRSLYVAQIGEKKFTSVEEAISGSDTDDTVKLIRDIEGQIDLTHTHPLKLDLNGRTIKSNKSGEAVVKDGSSSAGLYLTITDSAADGQKGAIVQEATDAGAIRVDSGFPMLKLNGITIETDSTECLQVIVGSVELDDVTMSAKGRANSLIYTKSSMEVTINSGTYTAGNDMALITQVEDKGKTVLNGGSFNIFPADGTLAKDKVLLKNTGSDGQKGYFEVVNATATELSAAEAEVEYSDAKIYFVDASEAAAFVEDHDGATLAKCVTATINEPESLIYDGNAKEAKVELSGIDDGDDVKAVVEYSGDGLVEGKPVAAGSYTAKVTGLSGKDANKYALRSLPEVAFEVKKAGTVIALAEPGTKTIGDEFKLNPSAYDGAKFTYESDNPTVASVSDDGTVKANAAGTAIITVSTPGDSNHTDASKSVTLTAKAADLSAAKVTLSKSSFTYNGKAQKPSVKSVVLDGKTLKAGTDYTASVASGKKVGTYNVTITTKGSYTGKTTSSFVINPKGVTKFKVSKAKKSFKAKWKKNKTERSGVQIKYSTKKSMKNAKTVKAKGAAAKAKTVKKLKKKTKYYVQVRAYKVVGGKTYYSGWSAKKAVKTK